MIINFTVNVTVEVPDNIQSSCFGDVARIEATKPEVEIISYETTAREENNEEVL